MEELHLLAAEDFTTNPFQAIGKDLMLITAAKDGKVNTMTAGWGGLGVMFGKNAAFIVIRESRYTKEFVDGSDMFSIAFFDPSKYKKMMNYMGTVSGRDEDKIAKAGLTVDYRDGVPYFKEASVVMLCEKMLASALTAESFTADWIDSKWYSDKNYHTLYIGEIKEILSR